MSSPGRSEDCRSFNRPRGTTKNVSVWARTSGGVRASDAAVARIGVGSDTFAFISTFRPTLPSSSCSTHHQRHARRAKCEGLVRVRVKGAELRKTHVTRKRQQFMQGVDTHTDGMLLRCPIITDEGPLRVYPALHGIKGSLFEQNHAAESSPGFWLEPRQYAFDGWNIDQKRNLERFANSRPNVFSDGCRVAVAAADDTRKPIETAKLSQCNKEEKWLRSSFLSE